MDDRIRLGVSACLLGEKVRYDGGHRRDPFITGTLSQYVECVPVCPEVECGLPVPREPMRLEGDPASPRLKTINTRQDRTGRMLAWCAKRVEELEALDLWGFIFKKGSPSSGMERVKVYDDKGKPSRRGVGMFARVFMEHFPLLPVEEDERLYDPKMREHFVEALFALKRWRDTLNARPTTRGFIEFHTRHKLQLLAHGRKHLALMGRLVASIKDYAPDDFRPQYQTLLMEALRLKTTPRKHAHVLQHAAGFLREFLSPDEESELLEVVDLYRQGALPLIVPLTLIRHHAGKFEVSYLQEQYYLNPHPVELQLRYHA
ncbi:MAG: DUF523 and DUF1722 domain-containing protein [Thermodesulfobacteriota bacterium]